MADKAPQQRAVRLEYTYDRLLSPKLAQAYQQRVPEKVWLRGESEESEQKPSETRGHLRPRIHGSAEKRTDDRESDGSAERTRQAGGLHGVPTQWVFEDEGYSGAVLVRPGLERLRDLTHEGQIQALWVYSPDRLSRK